MEWDVVEIEESLENEDEGLNKLTLSYLAMIIKDKYPELSDAISEFLDYSLVPTRFEFPRSQLAIDLLLMDLRLNNSAKRDIWDNWKKDLMVLDLDRRTKQDNPISDK